MIYVITHKNFDNTILTDNYKILQVGAYKGHIKADYYDDIGTNISNKNSSYCELTGIYWLWKNCNDNYIGIVHYRRYFSKSFSKRKIASYNELISLMKNKDCVLPFFNSFPISVQSFYLKDNAGFQKDLDNLRSIIEKKHPEYLKDFDTVMKSHGEYFYNMIFCKKKFYDDYCEWLFDIIFDLENITDTSNYTIYQSRIYGFLSERLLNVWILHNKVNVAEIGYINTEEKETAFKKVKRGFKRVFGYYTGYYDNSYRKEYISKN